MLGYRPFVLTTPTPSKPSANNPSLLIRFSDMHVGYCEAPKITTVAICCLSVAVDSPTPGEQPVHNSVLK